MLAALEFDAIRFPVLWERVAPELGGADNWEWSDGRLTAMRTTRTRPIVGLLHHGSGPRHTSLLDPEFPKKLAEYAARVAARYPWVTDWTPVNEPLTTARFSALYGFWYPHARDERLFWLALINQIDATRLAMRAIRIVQPAARLIQTEDLGRTYATTALAHQASFDNQRRWMTWDLLCGMVGPSHPLWRRLCDFGFEFRLRAIRDDRCPPDVIGIDHYLTSDRFLDHRASRYPGIPVGGNGDQGYCDLEAVRALDPGPHGLSGAIREAWDRYGRPIALTEVHNGCTREEQIRWLDEAWATTRHARAEGIDVCAVTAWALFGSKGWNTLLTAEGEYEPGAFDASADPPRPTALARAVKRRGSEKQIDGAGWWRRPVRLIHPAVPRPATMAEHRQPRPSEGQPILICGASGTLGRAFAAECRHRDLAYVLTSRAMLELGNPASVARALDHYAPLGVVNAAGWVRVDDAEGDPEACHAVNAAGAIGLAEACAERNIPTLGFSSDLVFNGRGGAPYREDDATDPLSVYGHSKAAMETGIAKLGGEHLVVRTAAFFSPFDEHNFAVHCLRTVAANERFRAVADCTVSPTYVPDLCRVALDLLIDRATGIWHLTNAEPVSWYAFARRLAGAAGLNQDKVIPVAAETMGWAAPRPASVPLESRRGSPLPSLDHAIERFVRGYAAR